MKVYGFVGQPRGSKGPDALLLRALNSKLTEKDLDLLFWGQERIAGAAGCMLPMFLGLLVDAWLNSGRNGDLEYPWERKPWREYLEDYIERHPPKLMFSKDGLALLLAPVDKPEKPSRVPSDAQKAYLSSLPDKQSFDPEIRKISSSAADSALALYLQLMDSEARTRLFRCDGCGVYFMRARNPKRGAPIKRGSYCAKCKDKGGTRRTDASRELRTSRRVKLAADSWPNWQEDRRHGKRSEWVATQVNKKLPANQNPIKPHWVTRHQTDIEAEVERRNHAKG